MNVLRLAIVLSVFGLGACTPRQYDPSRTKIITESSAVSEKPTAIKDSETLVFTINQLDINEDEKIENGVWGFWAALRVKPVEDTIGSEMDSDTSTLRITDLKTKKGGAQYTLVSLRSDDETGPLSTDNRIEYFQITDSGLEPASEDLAYVTVSYDRNDEGENDPENIGEYEILNWNSFASVSNSTLRIEIPGNVINQIVRENDHLSDADLEIVLQNEDDGGAPEIAFSLADIREGKLDRDIHDIGFSNREDSSRDIGAATLSTDEDIVSASKMILTGRERAALQYRDLAIERRLRELLASSNALVRGYIFASLPEESSVDGKPSIPTTEDELVQEALGGGFTGISITIE